MSTWCLDRDGEILAGVVALWDIEGCCVARNTRTVCFGNSRTNVSLAVSNSTVVKDVADGGLGRQRSRGADSGQVYIGGSIDDRGGKEECPRESVGEKTSFSQHVDENERMNERRNERMSV